MFGRQKEGTLEAQPFGEGINADLLPECVLREGLLRQDIVTLVERVVGQCQVKNNFAKAFHEDGFKNAGIASAATRDSTATMIYCLDLLAPTMDGEGWGTTIERLAAEATERGIDFAAKHG